MLNEEQVFTCYLNRNKKRFLILIYVRGGVTDSFLALCLLYVYYVYNYLCPDINYNPEKKLDIRKINNWGPKKGR